jgi:hypothetical protein
MKVSLNPTIEIKITDLIHTTIYNITKNRAVASEPLFWIDDVLFYTTSFENEELTQSASQGILYFDSVKYTESPKIECSKINGWNVDVLDMTGNQTLHGMIQAIKEGIK